MVIASMSAQAGATIPVRKLMRKIEAAPCLEPAIAILPTRANAGKTIVLCADRVTIAQARRAVNLISDYGVIG
jgi:hypothetical protein